MKMHCNFYAIKTNKQNTKLRDGAFGINLNEIQKYNDAGYDVVWTMNGFEFGKRKKTDLKFINCFYADIDSGSHKDMQKRIQNYLYPSSIIKTKNGFHLYWYLDKEIDCEGKSEETADWFSRWTKERIVPALNSDSQAADACRLLRASFMRYWKDGLGTFYTDIVGGNDKFYSLEIMEKYFPIVAKKEELKNKPLESYPKNNYTTKNNESNSFWQKANNLSIVESLHQLSGKSCVHGEVLEVKKSGSTYRIFCNGKPSNAWIDSNGLIGSACGAGPAIPNWVYWYQRDWKKVAEIIKQEFNIGENK